MTIQEEIHGLGVKARAAAQALRAYSTEQKNAALEAIAAALEEVDQDAAAAKLLKLLTAKRNTLLGDPYIKFKLIKYALSRGYRYDDVGPAVENILSEND